MATQCIMQTKFTAVKSFHPGEVLVQDGDRDILRREKTGEEVIKKYTSKQAR